MKKIYKDNLKKIAALLLSVSMTISMNSSVFAQDTIIQDATEQDVIDQNDEMEAKASNETTEEDALEEECSDGIELCNLGGIFGDDGDDVENEEDEVAREKECMPASPVYLSKLLTYLSLKYSEIGIKPEYGANGVDDLYNLYNATKMECQTEYNTIEINGNDTFPDHPGLTKNMVQFKYLGNFGGYVKTLIIRNVDEIRNLYVPASVETLIIENTTLNCYQYPSDSPGFQSGMNPGDLLYCKNLKKLVFKNVTFGDNYKRGDAANRLPEITYDCPYETNYLLNLQNCHDLEELEIDVSFPGAREVQFTINGGTENQFAKLTKDKCKINPAPGTGYKQVLLYANENSNLAKYYDSSETAKFKSERFRLWLLEGLGVDANNDGVISQDELDAIETLVLNDQTAHSAPQTSLSAFEELADIRLFHNLKTLEIDFYDPSRPEVGYRHILKGIDFPDSIDDLTTLENLTMKNIIWEKDTQTKSHDNADIILTNLKTLELYNTEVKTGSSDSYFDHPTQIELTDKEGVLQSCIIENTDVESIHLINNSNRKGRKDDDERQRIRFSAIDCQNLEIVEFSGEGYAVEGSLDLSKDKSLKRIGMRGTNENGEKIWTVYGEFDSTYAPTNVILNGCLELGLDCEEPGLDCVETVIDYDFINGRDINVQTMNTRFDDDHKLTILRKPKIEEDKAGNVYLSCDKDSWVYTAYENELGFVIENRTSFPTIAVFADGQRIRTSGEGNHNDDSKYTEDSDRWVERWDLVMAPGGYSNNFGNLKFYVVDREPDTKNDGAFIGSLRKVFYQDDVYVEWEQQNSTDTIITLPTEVVDGRYKLTGTKLSSTGTPGEVELKLYVLKEENENIVKSYIGYQYIKIFKMPDSVELVNDGTNRGNGTKDNPYIVYKNEELKLKARLLVNGEVDKSGDYALRDIYWRIKEYDETPKYTSDSDGYSLYTLDSATKAGISVVRGELEPGESETQYDRRIDNTFYNHRRFNFDTAGSKFKVVAQMPFKNNDTVITKEVFVEYHSAKEFWCSEIEDQIYTGKVVKPKLNIHYGNLLLVEGRDYTLSYSNNVNPALKTAVNSKGKRIGPSVTINGKGNYLDKRTYYFSIMPRSIEDTAKVDDIIVAKTKTNRNINVTPTVTLDGKKLKQGVDYVISTTTDEKGKITSLKEPEEPIEYQLYIVGKGNYAGAKSFNFTITDKILASNVTIKKIADKKYTGSPVIDDHDIEVTYKIAGKVTNVRDNFTVEYGNITDIGTATAIITAKPESEMFAGSKSVTFKIYGEQISKAKLGKVVNGKIVAGTISPEKYNGKEYEPDETNGLLLYYGNETTPLVKDQDYTVSYSKNVNAGTATATIIGKGKYTGTKKIDYKINKYDAGNDTSEVIAINNGADISVSYEKGGVAPKPIISMNGVILTEKKDYTLSYSNNKAVAKSDAVNSGGKSIAPTIVITYKGNFTGKKSIPFTITVKDIAESQITIADKAVSTKAYAWKQTAATIVDTNGKKLVAGTDYNKNFEYYSDSECKNAIKSETLATNTTVYVKVSGVKNYEGSYIVGSYRISKTNISTVAATIEDKIYSGEAICPAAEDIRVTIGPKNKTTLLKAGVDYEVIEESYTNNTNKGTASVTIRGLRDYYGTKTVKYKIGANKILWWIW